MTTKILFGTESGNAELVADDIADAFEAAGIDTEIVPMEDYDVDELAGESTVVVITSTYGEGELPATTAPFVETLRSTAPDLSGVRFAAFGLGDSSYDTYNKAIGIVAAEFAGLGATQMGETGLHDALSGESFTDVAVEWAEKIVSEL